MRGASALNGLLTELASEPMDVHVVWEPVLKTDVAPPVTKVLGLLDDERVHQYWDPERALSADIVRAVNQRPRDYGFDEPLPPEFIAWDVVAVFDKDARWERDLPVPVYYGGPVVASIEDTRAALK